MANLRAFLTSILQEETLNVIVKVRQTNGTSNVPKIEK